MKVFKRKKQNTKNISTKKTVPKNIGKFVRYAFLSGTLIATPIKAKFTQIEVPFSKKPKIELTEENPRLTIDGNRAYNFLINKTKGNAAAIGRGKYALKVPLTLVANRVFERIYKKGISNERLMYEYKYEMGHELVKFFGINVLSIDYGIKFEDVLYDFDKISPPNKRLGDKQIIKILEELQEAYKYD